MQFHVEHMESPVKASVTIYGLDAELLARVRAAAEAEHRSLSNYLTLWLERGHPAERVEHQLDIEDVAPPRKRKSPPRRHR